VADDPYTDPVTGVLLNKLGLGTAAELEAAEREITHAALILVGESPVHPGYDLPHLCAIHRRIFGDTYDWAGQIRTVAIAKGSLFCLPQYLETSAAETIESRRSISSSRCGLPLGRPERSLTLAPRRLLQSCRRRAGYARMLAGDRSVPGSCGRSLDTTEGRGVRPGRFCARFHVA
jgi:hypothetical protein